MLSMWLSVAFAVPRDRVLCAVEWGPDGTGDTLMPVGEQTALDADIGRPAGPRRLSVRLDHEQGREVRVRVRQLTSVSVGMEGPHLDLMERVHGGTDWLSTSTNSGSWEVLPLVDETPSAPLPAVDGTAIATAAFAQATALGAPVEGAQRWAARAATCSDATTAPCAVGPSHMKRRSLSSKTTR